MKRGTNTKNYELKKLVQGTMILGVLTLPLILSAPAWADDDHRGNAPRTADHPAAGSWFGKAVQLTDGVTPGVALYMTPTLTADGMFLGNDSLSLGGAPFGPHTTAHGRWSPVDRKTIIADYVFMLPGEPLGGDPGSVSGARFVWLATAVGRNTMVGYVNITIGAPDVPTWEPLAPTDNPTLPAAASALVAAPEKVYTDPAEAPPGTLVFKFNIARVQPTPPPARERPKKRR